MTEIPAAATHMNLVFQLFIKVFCSDGSAKSLLVDDTMSVAYLTKLLAEKSHVTMDPKWALVETIPELYMGKLPSVR